MLFIFPCRSVCKTGRKDLSYFTKYGLSTLINPYYRIKILYSFSGASSYAREDSVSEIEIHTKRKFSIS